MQRAPVNAINHALIEQILECYRRADEDPGVRAIVLTSAFDRAFSAGMDLAMIRGRSGLELRRYLETNTRPVAVRSSSLYEDAFLQPFAGVYDSYMLPNASPSIDTRVKEPRRPIRMGHW